MSYTAVRRIQFCAGHRVMEHGSKCRNLHGHNYVAFIYAEAAQLDRLGMVTDFTVLKDIVGGWIDKYWDHGFIFYGEDAAVREALSCFENLECNISGIPFFQKQFVLPSNPTAENMAMYLLVIANKLLSEHGIHVPRIDLYETENCFATVTEEVTIR